EWIHRMIHEIRGMPLFDALSGQTAQNLVMDQNIAMAVGNSLYLQQTLQYTSEVPWNIVPLPSGPYGNTSYSNAIRLVDLSSRRRYRRGVGSGEVLQQRESDAHERRDAGDVSASPGRRAGLLAQSIRKSERSLLLDRRDRHRRA